LSGNVRSLTSGFKKFFTSWKFSNLSKNEKHPPPPGLVVKADGSRSRGCGFEPRHRILDGCKEC
jgi:hypothetical protein